MDADGKVRCYSYKPEGYPQHLFDQKLQSIYPQTAFAIRDKNIGSPLKKYYYIRDAIDRFPSTRFGSLFIQLTTSPPVETLMTLTDIHVFFNGRLTGIKAFSKGQTSKLFITLHFHRFTLQSQMEVLIDSRFTLLDTTAVSWSFTPYPESDQTACYLTRSDASCAICNSLGYRLQQGTCVRLGESTYPFAAVPGADEIELPCFDQTGTLRCKDGAADSSLICKQGYSLQAGRCVPCASTSCKRCSFDPQTCESCVAPTIVDPSTFIRSVPGGCCPAGLFSNPSQSFDCLPVDADFTAVTFRSEFRPIVNKYIIKSSQPFAWLILYDSFTLEYNKEKLKVDFSCFDVNQKAQNTSECTTAINLASGEELDKEQIVFKVSRKVIDVNKRVVINEQQVRLAKPISAFEQESTGKQISVASRVSSAIITTVSSAAMLVGGASFLTLVKLTQYVEVQLLMSVVLPSNYRLFIKYIAEDFFSVFFNPFAAHGLPECELTPNLEANGTDCLFLQNMGSALIVLGFLWAVKVACWVGKRASKPRVFRTIMSKAYAHLSFDYFASLFDALLFDFLIPSLLNLTHKRADRVYLRINIAMSVVAVILAFGLLGLTVATGIKSNDLQSASPTSKISRFIKKIGFKFVIESMKVSVWTGRHRLLMQQLVVIASSLFIVFTASDPLLQVAVVASIHLLSFLSLLIKPPHTERKDNFRTIFCEGCQATCLLACFFGVQHARLCAIFLGIRQLRECQRNLQST